jgi:alpha-glucoside transport system ATP-binding protein
VQLADGGVALSSIATTEADMGRKVNVGVRPEDLVATTGSALFKGKVDYTEALGEVTILYFTEGRGDKPVIAKLPGIHLQMKDREVSLGADSSKIHIFADGQSLLYR